MNLNTPQNKYFKILLVEDDPDNSKLLELFLNKGGFLVQPAVNGKEAIEIYKRDSSIDLILMDVQMPVMDGISSVRVIREMEAESADGANLHMPIIALTAGVMEGDEKECLQAGYDHFISKPVDFNQLLIILNRFLKEK